MHVHSRPSLWRGRLARRAGLVEQVLRFAQDFGSGLGCPLAPQVWSEATKLTVGKFHQRLQLGAGGSGINRLNRHRHGIG
jgi:hypothetical protein